MRMMRMIVMMISPWSSLYQVNYCLRWWIVSWDASNKSHAVYAGNQIFGLSSTASILDDMGMIWGWYVNDMWMICKLYVDDIFRQLECSSVSTKQTEIKLIPVNLFSSWFYFIFSSSAPPPHHPLIPMSGQEFDCISWRYVHH